ncbi:MAG: hypothetical protein AAGB31_11805 [Bdellovibrio sp.]
MYSLEIKKKTMKVTIYGVEHELRFPTIEEIEAFDVITRTTEPSKLIDAMKSYLASLGLSVDVINKLDSIDFSELIAFVNNPAAKKK